jgi:hypothetical protein
MKQTNNQTTDIDGQGYWVSSVALAGEGGYGDGDSADLPIGGFLLGVFCMRFKGAIPKGNGSLNVD